jgi:hypothetical protein
VANQKGSSIIKLGAADGENLLTYSLPGSNKIPTNLIFDGTNLWVGCYWGYLMRFNVADETLIPSHDTGGHITGLARDGETVRAVVWYEGPTVPEIRNYSISLWLWLGDYRFSGVELPSAIAYDGSSFWVADNTGNKVIKLPAAYPSYPDQRHTSIPEEERTFQTGDGPIDLVCANGYMWVINERDGTINRLPLQ